MMYLRLGILAAFIAVSGLATVFYYRGNAAIAEAQQARANLAVAEDANHAQEATIGRLRASEEANAKQVAELLDQVDAFNKAVAETKDAIQALEKSNATVAAYLRTAVPDELKRLLDH